MSLTDLDKAPFPSRRTAAAGSIQGEPGVQFGGRL